MGWLKAQTPPPASGVRGGNHLRSSGLFAGPGAEAPRAWRVFAGEWWRRGRARWAGGVCGGFSRFGGVRRVLGLVGGGCVLLVGGILRGLEARARLECGGASGPGACAGCSSAWFRRNAASRFPGRVPAPVVPPPGIAGTRPHASPAGCLRRLFLRLVPQERGLMLPRAGRLRRLFFSHFEETVVSMCCSRLEGCWRVFPAVRPRSRG